MRHVLLLLALSASLGPALHAQGAETEIRAVIQRLFDGMRAGDSAMVRSVFDSAASFVSTSTRDGRPQIVPGSVDRFVTAVGRPHDAVWDERIWDVEIRVDDNLAQVWTKYAFFLGEEFSHCGVDGFHLVRRAEGWKIVHLADTRRREGCEEPPSG